MIISFRQPTVSGSVHSQVDYFSIMQQPVVCGFYTSVGKLTCLLAYFDLSKQCLDFLAMNDLRKSLLQCSSDLLTVVYRLRQFTYGIRFLRIHYLHTFYLITTVNEDMIWTSVETPLFFPSIFIANF
jgi:hypothetical protein